MKAVRLIREVTEPGRSGPQNGQYALQSLLRDRIDAAGNGQEDSLSWLKIGGVLRDGEIPWYWSWQDIPSILSCCVAGWPFVAGPNVLFRHSGQPAKHPGEREVLGSPHCRLLYTESKWYGELIDKHRGAGSVAPLVLWPYPIVPMSEGPPANDPAFDLLIYCKSGYSRPLIHDLTGRWPRCVAVVYGAFTREQLWDHARRSRACAYLSHDDRGPLALAEILLCGCPAIGVERGAPWAADSRCGVIVADLSFREVSRGIEKAIDTLADREAVRAAAVERFDGQGTVETIIRSLESVVTT